MHAELKPLVGSEEEDQEGGSGLVHRQQGKRPAATAKPRKKSKPKVPKAKPHKVKGSALTQGRGRQWRHSASEDRLFWLPSEGF